ncbi:UNVERIFIED_CONTAM: TadE-like protein [Acetivibrio alkalicellulosi]
MLLKLFKSKRGTTTIEASIIVPVVLLTVIALIYMCMLLYQKSHMQSVANYIAANGAAMWENGDKDLVMQLATIEQKNTTKPYWRIFDIEKRKKENKVNYYGNYYLKNNRLLAPTKEPEIKAELHNQIIYKKLIITINCSYNIPMSGFLKVLGLKSEYVVEVKGESVINEPAEFIRNIDYLAEIGENVAGSIDSKTGGKINSIKDEVESTLAKFTGKLKEFLE